MKELTKERITEALKEIAAETDSRKTEDRTFVMYTSEEGIKQFNEAVERETWLRITRDLFSAGSFTLEEYTSLTRMINSPDKENFVLAQEIIKAKQPTKWQFSSQHPTISTPALTPKKNLLG